MTPARALRHFDYRMFFVGHGVSLVGTWMQKVAFCWLVFRLTGSPLMLGLVSTVGELPALLVSPWAGVLLDRCDRRRALILTQCLAMVQALVLGLLAWAGALSAWSLVFLAAALGLINAFDGPARQALVPQLVRDPADLANAIALNSLIANCARVVGPSVAGVLVVAAGEPVCFVVNGASFALLALALLRICDQTPPVRMRRTSVVEELRQGIVYAWSSRPIRALLLLLAAVSLLGISYVVLLPVLAKETLGGNARTLGFLTAATGLGAMAASVHLATRPGVLGLFSYVGVSAAVFGTALATIGVLSSRVFVGAALAMAGFSLMVCTTGVNTLLQTLVVDGKRGRVMGLYTLAFAGMISPGALLAGHLAVVTGAPHTLVLCGAGCGVASVVFLTALPFVCRNAGSLLAAPKAPVGDEAGLIGAPPVPPASVEEPSQRP